MADVQYSALLWKKSRKLKENQTNYY